MLIQPSNYQSNLAQIDSDEITALYKKYGAILIRGFDLNVDEFRIFTDRFCSEYVSNKSPGRDVLGKDGRVQTVNLGERHFPLHPEISREPWQPDIAWFACEQPSLHGGETTFCDGIAAAKAFSPQVFKHLTENTLAHKLPTDLNWCRTYLKQPNIEASELANFSSPETFDFTIEDGQLFRTYFRPMLHQPMFSNEWAYGNFLVFARKQLRVRNFPTYADGSEVPDNLVDEIEAVTNQLAKAVKWQPQDLLMLDNTRVMHGRNPISDPQARRIYTQFGYVSFKPTA